MFQSLSGFPKRLELYREAKCANKGAGFRPVSKLQSPISSLRVCVIWRPFWREKQPVLSTPIYYTAQTISSDTYIIMTHIICINYSIYTLLCTRPTFPHKENLGRRRYERSWNIPLGSFPVCLRLGSPRLLSPGRSLLGARSAGCRGFGLTGANGFFAFQRTGTCSRRCRFLHWRTSRHFRRVYPNEPLQRLIKGHIQV
jgi:hypothetical protein